MGGCAHPIRGARVNRLRSNTTKRPIRGRELIKMRDLFKEIRYVYNGYRTMNKQINNSINGYSCVQVKVQFYDFSA